MSKILPMAEGDSRLAMDGVILRRQKNTMTDCLSPLLTSMRLFGLYFVRESEGSNEQKCKCNGWMIHSIFVVVLLWLNAVRMFSVFNAEDTFNMILLHKVIGITWMIQCAVSQTSFYATCHLGKLQEVFAKMNLSDGCALYLRRKAIIYAAAAWSVIAIGSAYWLYIVFFTDGSMDFALSPITTHVTVSNVLAPRIILYLLTFYLLAAHAFPQAMTYLLATLFSYQFKRVGEELDRYLDSEDGQVGDAEIETIRRQHQEISMSVSHIDDCLMFSNASAFCCQLCSFIILLYMIIFYNSAMDNAVVIMGNLYWMALLIAGLVFTAAGGIQINHYAHTISERVHDICLMNLSAETIGKVNVFLSRLTGDPIGFTVIGIFAIDKNTILTLIGLLITYFLLVVQLSSDYTPASPTTSNTTLAT